MSIIPPSSLSIFPGAPHVYTLQSVPTPAISHVAQDQGTEKLIEERLEDEAADTRALEDNSDTEVLKSDGMREFVDAAL